jgi:hypothetical protein
MILSTFAKKEKDSEIRLFASSCLSVGLSHVAAWDVLIGFSWNFILWSCAKLCWHVIILVKTCRVTGTLCEGVSVIMRAKVTSRNREPDTQPRVGIPVIMSSPNQVPDTPPTQRSLPSKTALMSLVPFAETPLTACANAYASVHEFKIYAVFKMCMERK